MGIGGESGQLIKLCSTINKTIFFHYSSNLRLIRFTIKERLINLKSINTTIQVNLSIWILDRLWLIIRS